MNLNLSDKNNYLLGILTLIGKERYIDNSNEKFVRQIADELGFNHYFIDQSIEEIKGHKFIIEEPPEFSNQEFAEVFIKDAIRFAFPDHEIHLYELQWLITASLKNKLSEDWLLLEIKKFLKVRNYNQNNSFEIQSKLNRF
jgi:hypothetical protein